MSDKLELSLEDLGLTQKDQEKVKKCCCVSCVYDKAADELDTADQITINIPGTTTSIVNQKQKAKTKRKAQKNKSHLQVLSKELRHTGTPDPNGI